MNRPYIICHMVQSIDGKVTGDFLYTSKGNEAAEVYYEINRELKCSGFICGRVTMESSFTNSYTPDLSSYEEERESRDFIPDNLSGFYAVSFDPKGKVGWQASYISDQDPGYDKAQVIEVVTNEVNRKYLTYLKSLDIPYIFAGDKEIDIPLALDKLKNIFDCERLLLEGGSIINGYFQRAGVIDELSLVTAPIVASKDDKPLFYDAKTENYNFKNSKEYDNGIILLNYTKE